MTIADKIKGAREILSKVTPDIAGIYTTKVTIEHKPTIEFIMYARNNLGAYLDALEVAVDALNNIGFDTTVTDKYLCGITVKALTQIEKILEKSDE